MRNTYSIAEVWKKTNELFYIAIAILLLILVPNIVSAQSQLGPIGPGKGSLEKNHIIGQLVKWDRKATPKLVLRIHGASMLQTFADISATGEFKLPLPEIRDDGNFGSLICGDHSKGPIVVATDISLLTTLSGFTSPGKWDRGFSVIGMAFFADDAFSKNIAKPGGKRAHWLYSRVARTVAAGECNNTNRFSLEMGWNAFTALSGPSGGPHTYTTGFDDDLGWYWYAFPEDMTQKESSIPTQNSDHDKNPEQPLTGKSEVQADWLLGEWNGVQVEVTLQMRLKPSGDMWLESIESGRKKTMEGKWSLSNGELVLDIEEGILRFNIEQTSETGFRLFGKATNSDIVFTRQD